MTRFDAADPDDRRALFVDAIAAHEHRESPFLTVEAEPIPADEPDDDAESAAPPWVQYGDGTLNLDCTDEELDRLKSLLDEFSAITIDDLHRPEQAEGTNVRLTARTDPERVAQFLDRTFLAVYERPDDYRVWAAEV
ncbi:hypothetical protein SAMN06269185_1317 [Natronoarchaeum philippinense]|uniref:DUF7975 domain-containing protein n=1 Tax=Natronoarchaeum philippinense TaxID=558529 RepID=A0A285ND48_NATPI|nr:hypothetical protein [Natronoarchaeum philippinense]SNZ06877.1 hypothetical protein SAMN06269185_1317 [Natronoarchaeum philippinense]